VFDELKQLWFDHLGDNISTVRENSAVSIGRVMTSDLKDKVKEDALRFIS
jgi:hypothetical protein